MPSETLRLGVTFLLGALAVTAVARLRPVTRGTTLFAPWCWAIAGALAVAGASLLNARVGGGDSAPWLRYLAGATLLAAPMAVLGAKRPQDRAWQWVVLSLMGLALLPAGHQWLSHPGSELRLEPAWQWFVLAIGTIGVSNYLLTSRALAAALAGVALHCFLGEQFPAWMHVELPERDLLGLAALASAAALARRNSRRQNLPPHDRLWRDFRDLFGAAWALRCAERFNASGAQPGDRATLGWHGFTLSQAPGHRRHAAGETELTPAESQCLENLLRRFVSPEWISTRLTCEPPHESTVQEVNPSRSLPRT